MKVKLLLNLGWRDADAVGLGHLSAEQILEGAVLDVEAVTANQLVNDLKCAVLVRDKENTHGEK